MKIVRSPIITTALVLASLLLGCSSAEPGSYIGYKDPEPARFHTGSTSIAENPLADDVSAAFDDSISDLRVIETVLWSLEASKVECQGFILSQCFLIQSVDGQEAEYFYDQIHGFEYEWGHRYELLVDISESNNASPNQTKHYSLNSIISKTDYREGATFEYIIRYGEFSVENIATGQYRLPGGPIFTCNTGQCSELEAVLVQDESAVLVFEFGPTTHDPLQLRSIACASTFEAFDQACL